LAVGRKQLAVGRKQLAGGRRGSKKLAAIAAIQI